MRNFVLFSLMLLTASPVFSKNPAVSLRGDNAGLLYKHLDVEPQQSRMSGPNTVYLKKLPGLICSAVLRRVASPFTESFCDLDADIGAEESRNIYESIDVEPEELIMVGATTYMKQFGPVEFRKTVVARPGVEAVYSISVREEEKKDEGDDVAQVSGDSAQSIYKALNIKAERVGPGLYLKKVGSLECGRSKVPGSKNLYKCELSGLLDPSGKAVEVKGTSAEQIYEALDVEEEQPLYSYLYQKRVGPLECSQDTLPFLPVYQCLLSKE